MLVPVCMTLTFIACTERWYEVGALTAEYKFCASLTIHAPGHSTHRKRVFIIICVALAVSASGELGEVKLRQRVAGAVQGLRPCCWGAQHR